MAKKETEKANKEKLAEEKRAKAKAFVAETLVPALNEVKADLEGRGREVIISAGDESATIRVNHKGMHELDLTIDASLMTDEIITDRATGKAFSAKSSLRTGNFNANPQTITKDEIIREVISRFKDRL